MPFSDQEVFQLTKYLYNEIYTNFIENYIGEKQPLEEFQENYIQPLYPAKKIQQEKPEQTTIQKISQYRHKYDREIVEFSQSDSAQTQENQSEVSYFSAIQRYSLADVVCRLKLGRFFCWKTTPPDHVYEDLGLGICLYLKFMKHLVYVLLFIAVLSAVVMSIFYQIAQSNKYNPNLNYQKVLFSLGMGSLSLEGIKCIHENITISKPIEFDLACPVGSVRVLGPVYATSLFETLQTCKKDIMAFVEKTPELYINQSQYFYVTNCDQELSNCTYNVTVSLQNLKYDQISVTYECVNGKSRYGATDITRSTALYIAVVFDLLMIVCMMLFYWSESAAQKKEQAYFKSKQILLNAFTLEIGTFSKRNFDQQFKEFVQDLQKQIKKQNNLQLNLRKCIIQVRLPDNDEYDRDQAKRQDAYRNVYSFMGQHFIQKQRDPNKYIDDQDFKKSVFSSQSNFRSYRRKLGQLIKQYRKVQKLKGKNHDEQLKIYVVFLKPKYKRLVLEKTKIILGKQLLQTQRKDYQIIDPPAPSLVLWNNIGKNKIVRGIISWTLSLLILLGTYILTAYILSLQNQAVVGQYDFYIQCQNVFSDQNYNQFNQQYYEQYKLSYTHCYCLTRSIIFSLNFEPVCNDWRDQYSLFLAIPVLYGLGLFVLNQFVSSVYRKLSEFEAHQYLTSELYSFILKKTILQTTDLALIIVLLSIDFNKKSTAFDFLLIGSYDDVSADWHLQVGIVIIVNLFFNIFSPFVQGIFYIGDSIKRKVKLCFFHKKSIYNKTKMSYIEYYREDVFPVEERYASILAILFICLALNCIYPIMTIIMTVSLFLYQAMDKLMIMKVYHKPLNYEGLLQKKIMGVFFLVLLGHLIITAIFLTEPFLVVAGHASNSESILGITNTRGQAIFQVGYVLPYMILLVVIVVFVIVIHVSDHYFATKPNPRIRLGLGGIPFEQNKYYNLLDAYQLDRTIALKRRQIQRNKILQKRYMKKLNQNQQLRQSHPNTPMIPTRKKDLVLNANKSILSEISQYSYYRLLKRKVKTSKDQQKLIRLAGMTAYEWQQDWIYFDQQVRLDYKIPEIDSYLNKISEEAEYRVNLIRNIIELARIKNKAEGKADKQIQKDQQIKEEKDFEQIINNSNVTSLQEADNSLQIVNSQLPILALEKQIEQMQRLSMREKSLKLSKKQSLKQDMMINLKVLIDPTRLQTQSQKSARNKLPQITQQRGQYEQQINSDQIKFQIPSQASSKRQIKRQYIEQADFGLQKQNRHVQIKNVETQQQMNSEQQEDNENQKVIQSEQNLKPELNISEQRIKQGFNTEGQFDLNQLPSQKILFEKEQNLGWRYNASRQ